MSAASFSAKVTAKQNLAADICRIDVALNGQDTAHRPHAGQFYMLRCWGAGETPVLSRPISVHAYDKNSDTLTTST